MKRLDQLKAQREALDRRIKELAAAESREKREADKRRKIIIGGWVLKHRPNLVREIIANGLEREQDKAAFADWGYEPEEQQITPALTSAGTTQSEG